MWWLCKGTEIVKYKNFILSRGKVSLMVGKVAVNDLLFSSYFIISFSFLGYINQLKARVTIWGCQSDCRGSVTARVRCGHSGHTALTCLDSVDCGHSRHMALTCVDSVDCGHSRHKALTCVDSVDCGLSRHTALTCVDSVDCGYSRHMALTCVDSVDCGLSRHTALTCVDSVDCGLSRHTALTCVDSVDCGLSRHTALVASFDLRHSRQMARTCVSPVDLSQWPILAAEQLWRLTEIPIYNINCTGKSVCGWANCTQRDMWVAGECNVCWLYTEGHVSVWGM